MLIKDLPFIWRLTDAPDAPRPDGVPARMDFTWDWDASIGLLKQRVTDELRVALKAIYAAGSANLGATPSYGDAFWEMIMTQCRAAFGLKLQCKTRTLEIGPGSGWLAKKMARFVQVQTCEHFPESAPGGQFNLIVHHHVLEHVEDPVAFLVACRERLTPDGIMVMAVPDCTESVALGDVSMATHQHLSYFSRTSLLRSLQATGFNGWSGLSMGGTLIVSATEASNRKIIEAQDDSPESFGRFISRAIANRERVGDILEAFYSVTPAGAAVPMRLLPYADAAGARLFDDGMAGKYLDGVGFERSGEWFGTRMEPLSNLEPMPVDVMFVMSLTHEDAIVRKLAGKCKIITLREMLNV